MTKTYYHATPYENLISIMMSGIYAGGDGYVYLTNSPESAATFVAIRGCKDILVCGVDLEEDLLDESFDHSLAFFKCRAWMHKGDISVDDIKDYYRYKI